MQTVTIGFTREDGDIAVLATFNNNDLNFTPDKFRAVVHATLGLMQALTEAQLQIYERQDSPDYVTPEEADISTRSEAFKMGMEGYHKGLKNPFNSFNLSTEWQQGYDYARRQFRRGLRVPSVG